MNTPQNIIVHHSLTPKDLENDKSEQSFNNTHKSRGFPRSKEGWYIGYHFIVYSDGEVRQYREPNEVGAHCYQQGMNFKSIGICLEGNFDVEEPTVEQLDACKKLINKLQAEYNIPAAKVVPHRYYAPKSCWGHLLPDDVIAYLNGNTPTEPTETALGWCLKHLPEADWEGVSEGEAERFRSLAKRIKSWFT